MSYEVGTHIDFSRLDKREVGSTVEKKSNFQEAVGNAYDVGTAIVFRFTPQGIQAARRIPVSFA